MNVNWFSQLVLTKFSLNYFLSKIVNLRVNQGEWFATAKGTICVSQWVFLTWNSGHSWNVHFCTQQEKARNKFFSWIYIFYNWNKRRGSDIHTPARRCVCNTMHRLLSSNVNAVIFHCSWKTKLNNLHVILWSEYMQSGSSKFFSSSDIFNISSFI